MSYVNNGFSTGTVVGSGETISILIYIRTLTYTCYEIMLAITRFTIIMHFYANTSTGGVLTAVYFCRSLSVRPLGQG